MPVEERQEGHALRAGERGCRPPLFGKAPQSVAVLEPYLASSLRVGVWDVRGRSIIGLFAAGSTGAADVARLVDSEFALCGVNDFPDPDTPSGTVTVMRDVDEANVEVWGGTLRNPG